jgi:hypothetical protein
VLKRDFCQVHVMIASARYGSSSLTASDPWGNLLGYRQERVLPNFSRRLGGMLERDKH